MSISITFHGAAHTVTGSCFQVKTDTANFLIDCGMFQGPDVEQRNLEPYDFDPAELDFVLLTHAHIDHSGMLPKLVRAGFTGPIFATLNTIQLTSILLLDSAKIQENNYSESVPWGSTGVVELVYNTKDAQQTITQLRPVEFKREFEPFTGIKANYVPAAHVLGAASIEIELEGKRMVFSGDIGRRNHELIGGFDLDYSSEVDFIVMESLYGGVQHPTRPESVAEMMEVIKKTIERGGSVFIPAFAVQRTQELLHDFKFAKQSGALPDDLVVWMDSPMAQRVTEIYRANLDHGTESLFDFPGLRYVKAYRQSQRISKQKGHVVIAGSGMASGGRIVSHLAANLSNPKNSVIFVGYQAEGTLGREIVDGAKQVAIEELNINVKAEIHHLHGFSAHGDTDDLETWVKRYNSPRLEKIMLVHAEPERAEALRGIFERDNIDHPVIPDWKETIKL